MSSNSPKPESPARPSTDRRTSSLVGGFIKRTRSSDLLGERKASGSPGLYKKLSESEQEERLRQSNVPKSPPTLPGLVQQPQMETFGGDHYYPTKTSKNTGGTPPVPPVPPIPAGLKDGSTPDSYARTQSMTHRGRYSYAHSTNSAVNSPRRVRRRKDPTPYNVLIIGARNSGKTSFLNFLRSSLVSSAKGHSAQSPEIESPPPSAKSNRSFTHHYQELEIENEVIGLTLWDSPGLDKGVVDLQLREMSNFVESKFDDTFIEEMKVIRAPGLRDTHIHCVFLILDPQRLDGNINAALQAQNGTASRIGKTSRVFGALDEDFDIQVLKTLQGKTTVVPVISKADTVTTVRMAYLKKMVLEGLKQAGLDPLEALNFETEDSEEEESESEEETDEEKGEGVASAETGSTSLEDAQTEDAPSAVEAVPENPKKVGTHKRQSSTMSISTTLLDNGYVPFSILSPDQHSLDGSDGPIGRKFPWGFADPYNAEHCDFVKMKEACFGAWRAELKEASREIFYERWRTGRLHRKTISASQPKPSPVPRKSSGGIPISLDPRTR